MSVYIQLRGTVARYHSRFFLEALHGAAAAAGRNFESGTRRWTVV